MATTAAVAMPAIATADTIILSEVNFIEEDLMLMVLLLQS